MASEKYTHQDGVNHLFYSASGESLPRWKEAFPAMQMIQVDGAQLQTGADMHWLRVAGDADVSAQLSHIRLPMGGVGLVVLSDEPSDGQALSAFTAGAKAYCNTHADAEILRQVANVVQQGGLWLGESLLQRIIAASAHALPPVSEKIAFSGMDTLSRRELEVARLIAQGQSNKDIVRQLDITLRTVKAHVSAILEKLQVRDRLQIALKINKQS